MKLFSKFISFALLLTLSLASTVSVFAQVSAAAQENPFLDISSSYVYYDSIKLLKDRGVINGYPDGTFKPNKGLSRSELTKIVVISSNIPTAELTQCFPDIDLTQWYAPYVCSAKAAGLVKGYVDGTFKPSREISRAESIKIVAEAENFDVSQDFTETFIDIKEADWFYRYANTAKSLGVLPFSSFLTAGVATTRAEFSEIYARSITLREATAAAAGQSPAATESTPTDTSANTDQPAANTTDTIGTTEDPVQQAPELDAGTTNNTPLSASDFNKTISKTAYDSFDFETDIPQVFLKDEIYTFAADIDAGFDFGFAVLVEEDKDNQNFVGRVTNNKFEVDIAFLSEGDYKLGFIAGNSGKTKVFPIKVVDGLPPGTSAVSKPVVQGSANLGFRGHLPGMFMPVAEGFKLLKLSQSGNSEEFLSRQSIDFLPINYKKLDRFSEGLVNVELKYYGFDLETGVLRVSQSNRVFDEQINAVTHLFSEINPELQNLQLANTFTVNQNLSLSFATDLNLSDTVYLIKPDGLVETNRLALNKNGNSYSYDFTLDQDGTYVIEINNTAGLAVINHPIYKQGTFPLVGEYFDDFETEQDGTFNESDQKQYLLQLINEERATYNFTPVSLEPELSSLSRLHNNDMIDRDYFAHVSLDGLTPNDRRNRENISTPVGENLAKDLSTLRAHNSLMRSAAHRANILNPSWDKVGISVLLDDDGYYYVTQEFSYDFDRLQNEFLTQLAQINQNLRSNAQLTQVSEDWTTLMIDSGQFGTSIDGQGIFDSITQESGFTRLFSLISKSSDLSGIMDLISENANIADLANDKFGFGMQIDDDGLINFVLIFGS
ncbi:hypothetical protein HOH51_01210 [bacterium]|nr:hypothetical protein [bacterium]